MPWKEEWVEVMYDELITAFLCLVVRFHNCHQVKRLMTLKLIDDGMVVEAVEEELEEEPKNPVSLMVVVAVEPKP